MKRATRVAFRRLLCLVRGHATGDLLYRRTPVARELYQNPARRPVQDWHVIGHVCGRCGCQVAA